MPDAPAPAAIPTDAVEWLIADRPVEYPDAIAFMERRVAEIRAGSAQEAVWLVEHPPLYTAGTSAKRADLLHPDLLPVFKTGRGGQFTYHGPGQRVAYVMLDLRKRRTDIRCFVHDLEEWIIATLARFDVKGERREGRIGVWVERGGGREDKIAALGVRVRHWVSFHGISINVEPDLRNYAGIVPCGIAQHGVTSLVDLGLPVAMADVDVALRASFEDVFGRDRACSA